MTTARAAAAALALVLVALVSARVVAHGLRPGVLTVIEQDPGVFLVVWTEPVDTAGRGAPVEISFPDPCQPARIDHATAGERLDCGAQGLHGAIELHGLDGDRARVATLVRFADGRVIEALVDGEAPHVELARPLGRSAAAWIASGIEHIATGFDHIAFVVGLMLVVGTRSLRPLIATITAFTVAHSVTLFLAATGVLTLASAPVEATIAASVVLVAREATHDRPTLTRRAPWAVAFGFGLVHGLGFAGALASAGMPEGWLGWSLLCFNLGVELGQLAIVLASVLLVRVLGERPRQWLRRPAAYATGGLAVHWLLQRVVPMLTAVTAGS
ncbi:MAG: HupE/UreJ family protein [Myxococcales bacterium]|nr:HupE/UreJ family protein [Myxococcales bacterium]